MQMVFFQLKIDNLDLFDVNITRIVAKSTTPKMQCPTKITFYRRDYQKCVMVVSTQTFETRCCPTKIMFYRQDCKNADEVS